jgi:hypothetical protein
MDPTCANCETKFTPRRNVKPQRYCGQNECQKARKKKWQQQKLRCDPDYRQNQRDAQRAWRERNRDYWKIYRGRNAAYTARNRLWQHERNQKRRSQAPPLIANPMIAKMDASNIEKSLKNKLFTRYQLIPVGADGMIAKMDACIVEIREIASDSGVPAG